MGITEGHIPLLFRKLHSPDEPSEKLTVRGILASLTMVAHLVAITIAIVRTVFSFFPLVTSSRFFQAMNFFKESL